MDALLGQTRESTVEVAGCDGDMAVAGTDLIRVHADVVRQLQAWHVAVAGLVHEDVDGLLADRDAANNLEAKGFVEGDRAVDVGYAVAGVDERHTTSLRHVLVYDKCMATVRTNIEIEDTYVQTIMERYNLRTKTAAVDMALRHFAGQPMGRDEALAMRGAHSIAAVPADVPPRAA